MAVPLWARIDKRRAFGAIAAMQATAKAAIDWHRRHEAKGADLLFHLLRAKDPDTGQGLSEDALRDNVLTFLAAVHETTALALTWAIISSPMHRTFRIVFMRRLALIHGRTRRQGTALWAFAYTKLC